MSVFVKLLSCAEPDDLHLVQYEWQPDTKNNVSQIKHRDGCKIILDLQQFLNHINFITLR